MARPRLDQARSAAVQWGASVEDSDHAQLVAVSCLGSMVRRNPGLAGHPLATSFPRTATIRDDERQVVTRRTCHGGVGGMLVFGLRMETSRGIRPFIRG